MSSFAGAVALIQQRLRDNWTLTDIAFQNEGEPRTADDYGVPIPWVYCEVINTDSSVRGGGSDPTILSWLYMGLIHMHVFVPVGSGDAVAQDYAFQLGEIFRNGRFYEPDESPASPLCQIRTWAPRVDGGDTASDDGKWWQVTCTVPYEYFYQG